MMGERMVMQESLFYGFSLEGHVPADHMLRSIDRFDGSYWPIAAVPLSGDHSRKAELRSARGWFCFQPFPLQSRSSAYDPLQTLGQLRSSRDTLISYFTYLGHFAAEA